MYLNTFKFIFAQWYLDRNTDKKRLKMMAFNLFIKHTNMSRYELKNTSSIFFEMATCEVNLFPHSILYGLILLTRSFSYETKHSINGITKIKNTTQFVIHH